MYVEPCSSALGATIGGAELPEPPRGDSTSCDRAARSLALGRTLEVVNGARLPADTDRELLLPSTLPRLLGETMPLAAAEPLARFALGEASAGDAGVVADPDAAAEAAAGESGGSVAADWLRPSALSLSLLLTCFACALGAACCMACCWLMSHSMMDGGAVGMVLGGT